MNYFLVTQRQKGFNPLNFESSFQLGKLSKVKKIKIWI